MVILKSIIVCFLLISLVNTNINFLIVEILLVLRGVHYFGWDAIKGVYWFVGCAQRLLFLSNARGLALRVRHHLIGVGLRRLSLEFGLRARLTQGSSPLAHRVVLDSCPLFCVVVMQHLATGLLMVQFGIHLVFVSADASELVASHVAFSGSDWECFHDVSILIEFVFILGAVQKAVHGYVNCVSYFLFL